VTIKPKQLKTLFTEFGTVDSVRLRNVPVDPEGKMPRGGKVITGKFVENRKSTNAYVVFKEEKAVDAACKGMNMREVDGRHVRVDRAAPPSAKANEAVAKEKGANAGGEVAYDHTRSLFLGNLPYDVDEEDVIRLFHRSKEYPELNGSVEAVRVVRDRKTNLGKGIAFVLFRKGSDARTGLLLDGVKMGDGREVRVTRASKNREALKAQAEKNKKKREEKEAKKEPIGAARRLGLEKTPGADARGGSAAAWEGSRSRPGGKRQKIAFGGYDAAIERGKDGKKGAGGRGGGGPAAKGARTGKRPAVAARKAKAKAAAGGGGGGKKK
jgi:nucleolar protein 12